MERKELKSARFKTETAAGLTALALANKDVLARGGSVGEKPGEQPPPLARPKEKLVHMEADFEQPLLTEEEEAARLLALRGGEDRWDSHNARTLHCTPLHLLLTLGVRAHCA